MCNESQEGGGEEEREKKMHSCTVLRFVGSATYASGNLLQFRTICGEASMMAVFVEYLCLSGVVILNARWNDFARHEPISMPCRSMTVAGPTSPRFGGDLSHPRRRARGHCIQALAHEHRSVGVSPGAPTWLSRLKLKAHPILG